MKKLPPYKKKLPSYTVRIIKEAVDIVIGDDGFRSAEVVQVIKELAYDDDWKGEVRHD